MRSPSSSSPSDLPRMISRRKKRGGDTWQTVIIVALILFVVGAFGWMGTVLFSDKETPSAAGPIEPPEGGPATEVKLYFASDDGSFLVEEERRIEPEEDPRTLAVRILDALRQGPMNADLSPTVPQNMGIGDVYITPEGCAIVDLQGGLGGQGLGGVCAEKLAVYSMVNSLTFSIPQIKVVRFLVDGKEVETLLGHLDARVLFHPNPKMVGSSAPS